MTSLRLNPASSSSRAGAEDWKTRAAASLIKPHLRRLAGSGPDAGAVVVERVIGAAEIGTDMPEMELTRHLLVVPAGPPVAMEVTTAGRRQRSTLRQGELIFQPAGVPARPHWETELHIMLLAIDPACVKQAVDETPGQARGELVPWFGVSDRLLYLIARQLLAEYEHQEQPDRFYVESLAQTLVAHLITKYTAAAPRWSPNGPGPGDRRVRLVRDYLLDHLADKPTLGGAAAAAGLSPAHVAALFRAAMGVSPHRYLMQQRVGKARELLLHTPMSIAEVAARTGFADQSHLTRVMRQLVGVTPAALRRS